MITAIPLRCPTCSRKIRDLEVADSATEVVRAKCRGCLIRWQVKATLMKRDDAKVLHRLEWLRLSHRTTDTNLNSHTEEA